MTQYFHNRYFAGLGAMLLLGILCLIPGFVMADALNATTSVPFPRIGSVTQAFQTDALCALSHQQQLVFIDLYPENEFWMNLNGENVKLTPLPSKKGTYKFKFADTRIQIKYGPSKEVPPPGEMGMEGVIFKKAKITLSNERQKMTLKVKGGCDGGANYAGEPNSKQSIRH